MIHIIHADVPDGLHQLPDQSVQTTFAAHAEGINNTYP